MKKSSIPIVVITQSDGASLLASLDTHGDDVQARLDAESDVDAFVGGGQEESSLTSRQSPGPTRKKSDKEGVFINHILFCKDYFTVYVILIVHYIRIFMAVNLRGRGQSPEAKDGVRLP